MIYLDHNATTPVAPQVVDAMLPYLREHFGNPSSAHPFGVVAREVVEESRQVVARMLNADRGSILFTSGGTESNNLAIEGVARRKGHGRRHIIMSAVEHPSIIQVFGWLAENGFHVSTLPVDEHGQVSPDDLEKEIGSETLLVSVMHANNEVGTVLPIAQLAEIAHRHGALMHTDAAQSVGKIPVDVDLLGVDLLTVAGHKLYAPKGVGALFVRPGVRLEPVLHGGPQEGGLRPGTEAVAQIAALGEAARLVGRSLESEAERQRGLRDRLEAGLQLELGGDSVRRNGHPEDRLPNTLSISIRGIRADAVLAAIADRVAGSAGSACHAHDVRLSHVLGAMGVGSEWGMGTLRLSVGRGTTEEEVAEAVRAIAEAVRGEAAA